ncbi:hypothetical protein [Shewanella surugensis]|uniref:PIN domain-containing protein n=1 Tax=Shewanella surugensis TaxID=212020 RepID=A0ABT0L942_9GAMM|nr:hypothetical protein [Shewanella surugensis]MCL1124222.1 hypothetical protein [Shewanella surugensis]
MDFNPYDNFVFFDSCAFDSGSEEDIIASDQVQQLLRKNKKKIMVMHSVEAEMKHPNSSEQKKHLAVSSRKTVKLNLTSQEKAQLAEITEIIAGNGHPIKREADCFHVFEAHKYGGCFVTSDKGIYKHSPTIFEKFELRIVKPTDFLKVVLKYSDKI